MSRQLLKSTAVTGSMTLLSRILGLVREMFFASFFGATAGMDAFLVAFKIPNFLRRLFAEGAFAQSFVPVLSETKATQDEVTLRELIQRTAGTLAVIVFIISLIGMLTSAVWIAIFAPGFITDPTKFHLSATLLRITFPYLFFISLTALAGGVLNTCGKFAVPAFTPVLLNVSLILCTVFLSKYFKYPVTAIAWGVLIAGVVQFLFQLPFLWRLKLLVWPKWGWQFPLVKRILKLMVPILIGASVTQIGLFIDTMFASLLRTGSVSWLYYSDRLMQFPLGVFGVALSTVILPHLSKHHAIKNEAEYQRALDWALKMVVLFAVPAALGLLLLSGPLLMTLFNYGKFDFFDVQMAQLSLRMFALGLPFFIMVKVLVSAFFARQDMKTPVKVAVIALLVNIIGNATLIWPMQHAGIALATSLASLVNVALLFWVLRRHKIFKGQSGWGQVWSTMILGCLVMTLVIFWLEAPLPQWRLWHAGLRAQQLILLVVAGVVGYGAVLLTLGRKAFSKPAS